MPERSARQRKRRNEKRHGWRMRRLVRRMKYGSVSVTITKEEFDRARAKAPMIAFADAIQREFVMPVRVLTVEELREIYPRGDNDV